MSEANSTSLPTYTANASGNKKAPAYGSVFGKLQEAKLGSANNVELVKNSSSILCDSVGVALSLLFLLPVKIALVVVGGANFNNCPIERMIPIWMIVFGVVSIVATSLKALQQLALSFRRRSDSEASLGVAGVCLNCFNFILHVFLFAWFIAGNVWVFRNANQVSYNVADGALFCDQSAYLFSYAYIIVLWGLVFLGLCCACVCCLFAVTGVSILGLKFRRDRS